MECFQLHKPHPLHSCKLPSHSKGIRGPKHQLIINNYNKMPIFLIIWGSLGHKKLVVVCLPHYFQGTVQLQLQIWLSETLHLASKGLHSSKQIELINGWIPAAPKGALSLRSWYRTRTFDWRQAVKQSYNAYMDYTVLRHSFTSLDLEPCCDVKLCPRLNKVTKWSSDRFVKSTGKATTFRKQGSLVK